jgi:hypothetical protein
MGVGNMNARIAVSDGPRALPPALVDRLSDLLASALVADLLAHPDGVPVAASQPPRLGLILAAVRRPRRRPRP